MRKFERVVAVGQVKAGTTVPTDDDLKLINAYTLMPLSADKVYVRSEHLCNNQVDRAFEWFPVEVLQDFEQTIAGKSMLAGHDYRTLPLGRYYKAELASETTVDNGSSKTIIHLKPSFYIVKTAENEHLRAQIDGGVFAYKSIGFYAQDLICDLCNESILSWDCPHFPGNEYNDEFTDGETKVCTAHYIPPAEAVEGSIVYLGCQYDAEIVRNAVAKHAAYLRREKGDKPVRAYLINPGRRAEPEGGDTNHMSLIESLRKLLSLDLGDDANEDQILKVIEELKEDRDTAFETVEKQKSEIEEKTARIDELTSSLGEAHEKVVELEKQIESLRDEVHKLQELDEERKELRADITDEIERLAALLGLESTASALLTALETSPVEQLKAIRDEYREKVDDKFPRPSHSTQPDEEPNDIPTDLRQYSPV